jgi:hypothetical protein
MSHRLVVLVDDGRTLLWVQAGRIWRADLLCRESGFTPWRVVDDAPGVGGRVLDDAEIARLVPPHEVSP